MLNTAFWPRLTTSTQRWILVIFIAGLVALLALLAFTFWRFPAINTGLGTGPKANIPLWFGTEGANIAYLLLGLGIATLYLWTVLQGSRSSYSWSVGALGGLLLGALWLLVSFLAVWVSALSYLSLLALFALPFAASIVSSLQTGKLSTGVLAGFWCGLVAAVLIACSIILIDNVFALNLIHSSWAHDTTCPLPTGTLLASCEISDDLGFVAMLLTLMPMLLAGIGLIGGALGVASNSLQRSTVSATHTNDANRLYWRVPLIFASLMLALFLAELIWKLW